MNEIGGTLWRQVGVSIVSDAKALAAAAGGGCTVPLRTALGWGDAMPEEPPGDVRTVVITGLQTALDVLPADGRDRVQRGLRRLGLAKKREWMNAALVFSVQEGDRLSVDLTSGSLMMKLAGGGEVELGNALWGGAAREVRPIEAEAPDARGRPSKRVIGYWVRHES